MWSGLLPPSLPTPLHAFWPAVTSRTVLPSTIPLGQPVPIQSYRMHSSTSLQPCSPSSLPHPPSPPPLPRYSQQIFPKDDSAYTLITIMVQKYKMMKSTSLWKCYYYRRPIGDPSNTSTCFFGDQHAPSETNMSHWRPTCPIRDRHAQSETNSPVETHWRPDSCLQIPIG